MKATDIKRILKERYNLTARVKTGTSKNPYINAWVDYDGPDKFPIELRAKCLRIIYGENCDFADRGEAGNISPKSIAMHIGQWVKALE